MEGIPFDPLFILNEAQKRNHARWLRVFHLQMRIYRICPWMRWSFMGYITAFWTGLLDEGPRDLLKPRWGGITFGWLNDGIKPTVWHTLYQLFFPRGKYAGIYPEGAPRSLADARRIDCEYEMRRLTNDERGCMNPREHTNWP